MSNHSEFIVNVLLYAFMYGSLYFSMPLFINLTYFDLLRLKTGWLNMEVLCTATPFAGDLILLYFIELFQVGVSSFSLCFMTSAGCFMTPCRSHLFLLAFP